MLIENIEYRYISISRFWFIFWIITAIILSVPTLFLIWIYPIYYYFILKNCKYYYNSEKFIVETGVFYKKQKIIPLYRIINITAEDNIFNFGKIYIKDKEQLIILKYVKNSKREMMEIVEKWENAKKDNIRNEII